MRINFYRAFLLVVIVCVLFWTIFTLTSTIFSSHALKDTLINQELLDVPSFQSNADWHSDIGRTEMLRSTVSIIGVGRNVAKKLDKFLPKIDELSKQFLYSQTVFVVGDTTDNSLSILQQWADSDRKSRSVFSIDSIDQLDTFPGFRSVKLPREGRIALARNLALDQLRKLPQTDYLIIVDMDIVGWDPYGIQDTFGRKDEWDAACAHGIILHGIYRDTYALRMHDLNNNHHLCGEDHELYNISEAQWKINRARFKRDKKLSLELMDLSRIARKQRAADGAKEDSLAAVTTGAVMPLQPIRVDSCFGGLSIYKYAAIEGCRYEYRHPDAPHMLDCEHVLFNQCLSGRNSARIISNPNMKLWYGHSGLGDVNLQKEVYTLLLGAKK